MDVKREIEAVIRKVAREGGKTLVPDLDDETLLLRSGLDSLDFAIVVVRLEEELDADPFSAMSEPAYPRTLGEFIDIYERYFSGKT